MSNPTRRATPIYVLTLTWLLLTTVSGQDPAAPNNLFGIKNENQTEVFVAADVPKKVAKAVRDTLAVGVDTWGSSGRLEYWVLGTDRTAAVELAAVFCKRRVQRGQMRKQDCLNDSTNKDHGFLTYQEIGANALATGRPHGSAGHNGGAEWGMHRMSSSLPLGFAGVLDIAGEQEQITILHEYWHSIQNSFIQSQDHRLRRKRMGPVWFVEGSAVAMAEITCSKLWKSGKLPKWNNSSQPTQNLRKRMTNKMNAVQRKRKDCQTLLPDSYDDSCRQLAYDSGGWAIAYLMNQFGEDVLLKSFHPNVNRLGWEACFRKTFGQSSADFADEFQIFMDLPLQEQIKILPQD